MGTKNNPGAYDCYESADPDEPMFVLLARDELAADLVDQWAYAYSMKCGNDPTPEQNSKVNEAYQCALDMRRWLKENPDGS